MKRINHIYKHLTNFLNAKSEDRREVTQWYDDQQAENPIDEVQLEIIQQQAKTRVLSSIKRETKKYSSRQIYGWSAAAVAVLVGGFLVWNSYLRQEIATTEQLALIEPAKERAIIVLEDGQEIDLGQLALNESLKVGETVITKDAEGRVRYYNASGKEEEIQVNSLRVPKASTYQLTLVDGTRVTLNSDSKLTYPSSFGTGDRVVQLEGEGYFEVTKTSNKSRFIVEANKQEIQVLGTKFNVKSYPEGSNEQTTLIEGVVKVGLSEKNILLNPGEQASSGSGKGLVKKTVDVDNILSWIKGQFIFDGNNTAEVLQEIARWYDIDITYEHKENVAQYIGKIPRNLSLDRLVELLNYADLDVKAVVKNNNRINLIIK